MDIGRKADHILGEHSRIAPAGRGSSGIDVAAAAADVDVADVDVADADAEVADVEVADVDVADVAAAAEYTVAADDVLAEDVVAWAGQVMALGMALGRRTGLEDVDRRH